ncbi:MAG: fructose-bisphosphate aldolase, partial [Pseudonocardia sp.]|nr:fructose-bisphosphate aldolase [Pseudonocardia sp.]
VAESTVDVLRALPSDLAGVAFLSGGQAPERATANLAAMQHLPTPWPLTFSFGRALVDPALAAWAGDSARVGAGQDALAERVAANAAATRLRAELQPA